MAARAVSPLSERRFFTGIAVAILITVFIGFSRSFFPVPPLQFLAIPLFDMALFATFTALAIVKRRDAQSHKRSMLLATTNLVTAAIALADDR